MMSDDIEAFSEFLIGFGISEDELIGMFDKSNSMINWISSETSAGSAVIILKISSLLWRSTTGVAGTETSQGGTDNEYGKGSGRKG